MSSLATQFSPGNDPDDLSTVKERPSVKSRIHQFAERGLLPELQTVCEHQHVMAVDVLRGQGRTGSTLRVAAAKAELCCVLRFCHRFSFPEIGELVGIDHTTVMTCVRDDVREAKALRAKVRGAKP